jgi:hypothetical protein
LPGHMIMSPMTQSPVFCAGGALFAHKNLTEKGS